MPTGRIYLRRPGCAVAGADVVPADGVGELSSVVRLAAAVIDRHRGPPGVAERLVGYRTDGLQAAGAVGVRLPWVIQAPSSATRPSPRAAMPWVLW